MKLLRYGPRGEEKPGMLDAAGNIRSLANEIADIDCQAVTPEGLSRLRELVPNALPLVEGSPRLGPPIANSRQFIALGRNYAAHVKEVKFELPTQPMVFNKALTSISGPTDDIPLYPGSTRLDYEAELAVIIGRPTFRISVDDAIFHVAGYCVGNDVSEREWQFERGGLVNKGKSAPGFGPLGPWLVTADEVPDPQALRIRTRVNGAVRQDASTSDMIFTVAYFIAHLSEYMALLPGDVILTGTPEGVALGMDPPAWLRHGDLVEMEIGGLGSLRQKVVSVKA